MPILTGIIETFDPEPRQALYDALPFNTVLAVQNNGPEDMVIGYRSLVGTGRIQPNNTKVFFVPQGEFVTRDTAPGMSQNVTGSYQVVVPG